MSRARIVFANGSKAMAHNLNDQYERWMLRRKEVEQQTGETAPEVGLEVFVPDMPDTLGLEEMEEFRQVLIQKKQYINEALHQTNVNKYDYGRRDFQLRRAALGLAGQKIQAQQSAVNFKIKERRKQDVKATAGAPANTSLVPTVNSEIAALNEKDAIEGLTTEEMLYLASLTFSRDADGNEGDLRQIRAVMKAGNALAALRKQSDHIDRLNKQLAQVQWKLIAAYERIIELQTGEPF